jgi:hypothetical protein
MFYASRYTIVSYEYDTMTIVLTNFVVPLRHEWTSLIVESNTKFHVRWCCRSKKMTGNKFESSTLVESGQASGILLNDAGGLCLASKGDGFNSADSGVYTNLVRLASQLEHGRNASDTVAPLVTIETDESLVFCKEYHGHCVAIAVPLVAGDSSSSTESVNTSTPSL